jgi:2-amino-4-hydroxy-6-hydroxymethyldihydropteridine diphosphokinase
MRVIAFIGLGANLEAPLAQVERAVGRLDELEKTRVAAVAPYYRSRPVGPADQPDYVNTVAKIETELAPEALLAALKEIEHRMGRVRAVRWGARVIDLDLLLYGDAEIATENLEVPHREIANRRFVLAPLGDLVPDLVVPGRSKTVRALLAALGPDESGEVHRLAAEHDRLD